MFVIVVVPGRLSGGWLLPHAPVGCADRGSVGVGQLHSSRGRQAGAAGRQPAQQVKKTLGCCSH